VEDSANDPVSQPELIRLAVKLREDLINYEAANGSSREFAEVMNTAGALIVAILEPDEFGSRGGQPSRGEFPGTPFPHLLK
jgi:hypothetical protein